jgi:Lipocalin-like domain
MVQRSIGVQGGISVVAAIAAVGFAWLPGSALAQTARDLVGSWTLVSAVNTAADGTRTDSFGASPKGLYAFESNGRFTIVVMRADLPKFASDNRNEGTPEENKSVVQGSIAMFGTYAVADKLITLKVEASTWPSWTGTEQKRIVGSYTGDELKLTAPASIGGVTEITLRRVKPEAVAAAAPPPRAAPAAPAGPTVPGAASAPPSLPVPSPVHLNRFVPSGDERLVAFYPTLFVDCSQRGPTVGRITSKPAHGALGLTQGDSFAFYNPNSSMAGCSNKKVNGLFVTYKSDDGYVGEDNASVLLIFADGSASQLDLLFLVR